MKVGDMVRWIPHNYWSCGGLGMILEINSERKKFFIIWFGHVEEYGGWKEAIAAGTWYESRDFDPRDGIEVM